MLVRTIKCPPKTILGMNSRSVVPTSVIIEKGAPYEQQIQQLNHSIKEEIYSIGDETLNSYLDLNTSASTTTEREIIVHRRERFISVHEQFDKNEQIQYNFFTNFQKFRDCCFCCSHKEWVDYEPETTDLTTGLCTK